MTRGWQDYSDDELQRIASGRASRYDIDQERRIAGLGGMQGELGSFLSSAGDSASLGFGDEIMGAGAAIGAALSGRNAGEAYRDQVERSRQRLRDAWQNHSGAALGGALVGALPMGGAIGWAARGARAAGALRNLTPAQRIMAAAASGGATGAVYGVGSDNDDRLTAEGLGKRALGGLMGAGLGAGTGAVLQGAGMGLRHAQRNLLRPALETEERAAQELARGLNRAGITSADDFAQRADELARMEQLSPGSNPMVMDALEGAGTDLTMVAGARQSAGRNAMRNALEARNEGVRERTTSMLWRELGGGAQRNAARTIEELEEVQRKQAAPLFEQAYRQTVQNVSPALQEFIKFNSRSGARFNAALETTRETMRRMMGADATDEMMQRSPLFWHRLLENTSAEVGAAMRSARVNPLGGPRGSALADMTQDAQRLNVMVRRMLGPQFNRAMDMYAGAARTMDAVELGYSAVSQKGELQLGQLGRRLQRMSAGERQAARFAAISRLSDELARADPMTGRADVLRSIVGNQAKRDTLRLLFGGDEAFQRVMRVLDYERRLFLNYADTNIGRGSPTADKMQGAAQVFGLDSGGPVARMRQAMGREAQQRYDEQLANNIMDLMRTPLTGPNAPRDVNAFAQRRGLLSLALRRAQEQRNLRAEAGPLALQLGATNALGFAPNEVFAY